MNSKHTPGPWRLVPGTFGNRKELDVCGPKEGKYGLYTKTLFRTSIGVGIPNAPGHVPDDENLANMVLAAAAPEMLEELRELRRCLRDGSAPSYGEDGPDSVNEFLKPVDALLARINGEG
jgi:hypothetical protein